MSVRNLNLFGGLRGIGEDMSKCEQSCVDMEVEMERKEQGSEERRSNSEDCSGSDMRWEKFVPRGVVRVLLVEADDSTRQIISAYLRKCNYKVAAVADGLKAWEVLKERPHKIDLILAEVDLPSISGFSLLALIMEDDYCKNIPVIMMSSQDSIGTVYKCMMRGASDFLMKPIRINELKHVWQHIWRRRSSSCLDLDKEAKSASAEEQSQELSGSEKMQSPAIGAEDEDLCSGSSTMAIEKTGTTADDSSRAVIDFIGTFDNKDRYVDQQSNNNSIMLESPALNLSLSRSELSGFENEGNQSDAPGFSWYTNKGFGSLPNELALPICHEQERKAENMDPVTDQSGSDSVSSGALSNPCRFTQREAALTKFRLKRKERCFEKKVRYESRKNIADKRPRVKGQFVRRIPDSPPLSNPAAACASAGDYLANERPVFCFSVNY